jgi:hypothetical protein
VVIVSSSSVQSVNCEAKDQGLTRGAESWATRSKFREVREKGEGCGFIVLEVLVFMAHDRVDDSVWANQIYSEAVLYQNIPIFDETCMWYLCGGGETARGKPAIFSQKSR